MDEARLAELRRIPGVSLGAGYQRMPLVEERGELAVRGHVLDLYPPHRELPLRIELFEDEIESIRTFEPDSQRSIDSVKQWFH